MGSQASACCRPRSSSPPSRWEASRASTCSSHVGWAAAAIGATAVFVGGSESVSIDLVRGVVDPGGRQEAPVSRLLPLALRTVGGDGPGAVPRKGRRASLTYQVVARGWHGYVLYQSFWREKAERKLDELNRAFAETREREVEAPPVAAESPLRTRLAALGGLLAFAAVGVAAWSFSPAPEYDCSRDGGGSVGCVVHRRLAGLVPLPDVEIPGVVSVTIGRDRDTRRIGDRTTPGEYDYLVLVGANGSRWRSPNSRDPFGVSNEDLRREVERLLSKNVPDRIRYVQAETFPTAIGGVFVGVPLLLLVAGFVLSRVSVRERPGKGPAAGTAAGEGRDRRH